MDVSALKMREATIVAGIWLTFLVGGLGMLYALLTWERPYRADLVVLFVVATLAGVVVWLLPRERIVRSWLREPFFLSWTMLDCALLVLATLADGGTSSPLVLVFFIPVVFSSMSYPLLSVVAVGIASVISYLGVALTVGGSGVAYEVAFLAALLCTAAMSAWQARNHNRQHMALAKVSRTDPLTGCLNRRGFEERALAEIGAMQRRGRSGAIVVVDIDHFKPVNDMFGHAAGDELLCWVSSTLERAVRSVDAVGRLGGDEFAVLLCEIEPEEAPAGAERMAEALRLRAPASFGIAIFPDDGVELEELTHMADMRLYASRHGRARDKGGGVTAAAAAVTDASRDGRAQDDGTHNGSSGSGNSRNGNSPNSNSGSGEQQNGGVEDGATDAGLAPRAGAAPEQALGPISLWRAAMESVPSSSAPDGPGREESQLPGALLDQIDASVMVTDMQGVVISWNSGAESLYGWSTEEAVGRSARELMFPRMRMPPNSWSWISVATAAGTASCRSGARMAPRSRPTSVAG